MKAVRRIGGGRVHKRSVMHLLWASSAVNFMAHDAFGLCALPRNWIGLTSRIDSDTTRPKSAGLVRWSVKGGIGRTLTARTPIG